MPRFSLKLLLVSLVVASAGCGLGEGGGEADPGVADGPSTDELPSAEAGGPVPDSAAGNDSVDGAGAAGTGEPADDTATVAGTEGPPANEPGQDTLSVEARLDRLIAGQEALALRLDSVAGAVGGVPGASEQAADSTDAEGAGERLGAAREQVSNFGVAVLWSVIVLIIVNLTVRGLVWVLDTLAERNARRRLFYKRLVPIVRIVLWVFAAYFIVRVIFQVDAQGIVAAAAAVGVAVGFAAQDLLKNLFGGVILVFDQPFQTGDKISVGGTYGEVVSIGLRSTRIVTPDDNLVSVPNAEVVDQQVANANAGELNCQVVTDLYLPGWADEAKAKRIAYEAAAGSRYVYLQKPIVVLVSDVFETTFLTRVRVKAYVLDPRLEFLFQSDVTERARAGFREEGLAVPEDYRYELVRRGRAPESSHDE